MTTPYEVSLLEISDIDALGEMWRDLQSRSRHSFFTSWSWIGCWLRTLPHSIRPQLLIVENAEGVLGLGLLTRARLRRGQLIVSQGLFLNEAGEEAHDDLTIEHNGLLADERIAQDVVQSALQYLMQDVGDWDELFLSGIDLDNPVRTASLAIEAGTVQRRAKEPSPCYVVDLAQLRAEGGEYLNRLTSNMRSQVRRSMRHYEKSGPLTLDCAQTAAEALEFFAELRQLHDAKWHSEGKPGAFAHPFCLAFHEHLIQTCHPLGQIQLLRMRAGEKVLGYLYNFDYQGRISSYQTGFVFDIDNKLCPGIVSHVLAIEYNRDRGADIYDFLAGNHSYKQRLGTPAQPLEWIVLQRRRAKFRLEDLLRSVKRRCGF